MLRQIEDIVESSTNCRISKKQRVSEDDQEDRISSLPDAILLHILSFLPIKEAVKTVLLQRFGNLWASVHTLDFDGRSNLDFSKEQFIDFVDHVLLHHVRSTIFKFSLKFGSNKYKPREHEGLLKSTFDDNIDSWICFALRKKVKVIDLGILVHGLSSAEFDYNLPGVVFTSKSIEKLKLVNIGWSQPEQIHMKSLKTLSLTTIMLNDKMIADILSGCPLLECLSLIQCWDLRKLNCTSANLTKLIIVTGECRFPKLAISGPHLRSLNISGLKAEDVILRDLSSLLEVNVDLRFGGSCPTFGDIFFFWNFLKGLHRANTFTVTGWCIQVMTLWELKNKRCPSSATRKHIVMKTMVTKWHLPGIASLLKSSPTLEMLTINIVVSQLADGLRLGLSGRPEGNYWNYDRQIESMDFDRSMDFDEERYFDLQPPFSCLTNNLKSVKICGCLSDSKSLLHLLKFLLGSSAVLQRMEISMRGPSYPNSHSASEQLLKFSKELSTYWKASASAIIIFS